MAEIELLTFLFSVMDLVENFEFFKQFMPVGFRSNVYAFTIVINNKITKQDYLFRCYS